MRCDFTGLRSSAKCELKRPILKSLRRFDRAGACLVMIPQRLVPMHREGNTGFGRISSIASLLARRRGSPTGLMVRALRSSIA
jgi:hypothetical protein